MKVGNRAGLCSLPYDRCKKRAYICSPLSADTNEGIAQEYAGGKSVYVFYAMKGTWHERKCATCVPPDDPLRQYPV